MHLPESTDTVYSCITLFQSSPVAHLSRKIIAVQISAKFCLSVMKSPCTVSPKRLMPRAAKIKIIKNSKVMKLVMEGIMLTTASRIILMFSWDLINLTILMILKALTTVVAVEMLDPEVVKFNTKPMSVPITTTQSNTFQPE